VSAKRNCGINRDSNVRVEQRVAALSQPTLIYPDSSIPSGLKRSYAACPLQRKSGGDLWLCQI
jgi:hypothetical protein